jgi:hypothetical protein
VAEWLLYVLIKIDLAESSLTMTTGLQDSQKKKKEGKVS